MFIVIDIIFNFDVIFTLILIILIFESLKSIAKVILFFISPNFI